MSSLKLAKYRKKYGIHLTEKPDADERAPEAVNRKVLRSLGFIYEQPRKAIATLEPVLEDYPRHRQARNYLASAYLMIGWDGKAKEFLEETVRQDPTYLAGILSYLSQNLSAGWFLEHGEKLGPNLHISDWPARADGSYQVMNYVNFEKMTALYLTYRGELDAAKERLNQLVDLGLDAEDLELQLEELHAAFLKKLTERRITWERAAINPPVSSTAKLDPVHRGYEPIRGELRDFLTLHDENIEEAELNSVLALPRDLLVAELRGVLGAALWRYRDFGLAHPIAYDDYDPEDNQPTVMALKLLGAMGAEEALQDVLNVMRLNDGASFYFFDDHARYDFQPTLFSVGKNSVEALGDYLLEKGHAAFDRVSVSETLVQIAHNFPSRRDNVLAQFERLWRAFLSHDGIHPALDTTLLSFTIGQVIDLRALDLLPLVEQLFARDWVAEDIVGNLEGAKSAIQLPSDPSVAMPQPATALEFFNMSFLTRKIHSKAKPGVASPFATPVDEMMSDLFIKNIVDGRDKIDNYLSAPKTVVRSGPKVGRNDPCPCGSKRKYKKCCL